MSPSGAGQRRVAVVIGSGSVKCAAALGLINVLEREGIGLDMLVGCSAGALFAAIIAAGHSTAKAAEMTRTLWTEKITARRNRRALLAALFPRLFGFDSEFGLRSDALVLQRLRDVFGDARIEDMRIPLYLTGTSFDDGSLATFARGSVVDAIRASIAMPFLFKPWRIDGRLYLDGYMADPLPVGVAIREGADVIVAMGFDSPYQSTVNSAGRFAFQVSSILSNNLLKSQFAFHGLAHHAEVLSVIPTFRSRIRLFDTGKIPEIIEDGERAAEEQLPYLRRLLAAQAVGSRGAAPQAPAAA
jgi:NTE family protein